MIGPLAFATPADTLPAAPSVANRCAFCGLPAGRRSKQAPAIAAPVYCCLGCRVAATFCSAGDVPGEARRLLTRLGLAIFCTMNVTMLTMALWTNDIYADPFAASPSDFERLLGELTRYACLVLSLPVVMLLAPPMGQQAWSALRQGRLTADLLLLAGVAAACAYSVASVVRGSGHVYFEVACVVLVAVTLGRWLTAVARQRTAQALEALERLLPEMARVVRQGCEAVLPARELAPGDIVRIVAGERIAADGRILTGSAAVDEHALTGESVPTVKQPGDLVFGGALNVDGLLCVSVLSPPQGGALARLVEAVREARLVKGGSQRLADRAAAWLLPLVAALAMGALAWHVPRSGWEEGLLAALAVVLIACPCALGLATPLALWSAMNLAARRGIVFSNAEALERLAKVRVAAFDKTGTLTTGQPRVADWAAAGSPAEIVLARAAGLATRSNHVFSAALSSFARDLYARVAEPQGVRTWPGLGVSGVFTDDGDQPFAETFLGSPRLMHQRRLARSTVSNDEVERLLASPAPVTCIGWDGAVRGAFEFSEELRPYADRTLRQCRELGLRPCVLTGDREAHARRLASQLGVDVEAELLPDEKVAAIARLQRDHGPTLMVGDGINDAPALAAADVGMALGCGADVSRESADICLLGNDLAAVPWTVALARKTVRTVRFNLFWAFAYNLAGMGLAITGKLNPVWAALAMVASSAFVVGNSLRAEAETQLENLGPWPEVNGATPP